MYPHKAGLCFTDECCMCSMHQCRRSIAHSWLGCFCVCALTSVTQHRLRFELKEKTQEVKELKDRLSAAIKRLQVLSHMPAPACQAPAPVTRHTRTPHLHAPHQHLPQRLVQHVTIC